MFVPHEEAKREGRDWGYVPYKVEYIFFDALRNLHSMLVINNINFPDVLFIYEFKLKLSYMYICNLILLKVTNNYKFSGNVPR